MLTLFFLLHVRSVPSEGRSCNQSPPPRGLGESIAQGARRGTRATMSLTLVLDTGGQVSRVSTQLNGATVLNQFVSS